MKSYMTWINTCVTRTFIPETSMTLTEIVRVGKKSHGQPVLTVVTHGPLATATNAATRTQKPQR